MSTPPRAFSERLPLTPNTNEPRTEPQTPFDTAKTSQSKFLRHDVSIPPYHPHLDSSESIPSAHASIYEASVFTPSTEHVSNRSNENVNHSTSDGHDIVDAGHRDDGHIHSDPDHEEERRAADEFAWSNCVPMVHSPHRLEPITEKNSLATLQTKASKGSFRPKHVKLLTDKSSQATLQPCNRPSNLSLRPQPSASTLLTVPTIGPTHRKSFSLPSFRRSSKSSSSSLTLAPSTYLNTLPKRPKRPPPERKPTPPGLPTFNTPAAIDYRLPAPPTRFRDHFRSSKAAEEYKRQTRALPRGVVMRGDNGEMIRGKWKPVASGHGIGGQHPWLAPEETANMTRYPGHDANERVRPVAEPQVRDMAGWKRESIFQKWWHGLLAFCCFVDRDEDGELGLQHVRPTTTAPAPLFLGGTNTYVPAVDVGA